MGFKGIIFHDIVQDMTTEEEELSLEAVLYARKNSEELVNKFVDDAIFPPENGIPISVFMAGSPGAGKTEISKALLKTLEHKGNYKKVVRIDPDEIREFLPGYNGHNSFLFQRSCSLIVDKIIDRVLAQRKNFILDGTFASMEKARQNITRSLERGRKVVIQYVYQDPLSAWELTQKRELKEGRNIPKDAFIEQLFSAKGNVDKIKQEYGEKIEVDVIIKDFKTQEEKVLVKVERVDSHVSFSYSKDELVQLLHEQYI